jgi:hypothetical protein
MPDAEQDPRKLTDEEREELDEIQQRLRLQSELAESTLRPPNYEPLALSDDAGAPEAEPRTEEESCG